MATKACGTYFGSALIETEVRHSLPISPMSEPSRATTSEDCGGWMSRHGSVLSVSWESPGVVTAKIAAIANAYREVTVERVIGSGKIPRRDPNGISARARCLVTIDTLGED